MNPKTSMESRFEKQFVINDDWRVSIYPYTVLAFIKAELKTNDKKWRARIKNSVELFMSTHDRLKKSFQTDDFIKFILEDL